MGVATNYPLTPPPYSHHWIQNIKLVHCVAVVNVYISCFQTRPSWWPSFHMVRTCKGELNNGQGWGIIFSSARTPGPPTILMWCARFLASTRQTASWPGLHMDPDWDTSGSTIWSAQDERAILDCFSYNGPLGPHPLFGILLLQRKCNVKCKYTVNKSLTIIQAALLNSNN